MLRFTPVRAFHAGRFFGVATIGSFLYYLEQRRFCERSQQERRLENPASSWQRFRNEA